MAMSSYITFDEYKNLGGTLSLDIFNPLERKARRIIDYITFDRVKMLPNIPESVKELMVEFISILHNSPTGVDKNVKSYSNGVESISYGDTISDALNKEFYNLATLYLPDYLVARSVGFDFEKYLQSESNNIK